MFTKLMPTVLTLLTLPLVAQQTADVARPADDPGLVSKLQLQLAASDSDITGSLAQVTPGKDFFGVVTVSLTGATIQFPGLPLLLNSTTVMIAGPREVLEKFQVQARRLSVDLWFQGIGVSEGEIQASDVQRLPGARKPYPDA